MSTGLDAVYEELKRLQLEGMDRVFIEDSTMALLKPATPPTAITPQPAPAPVIDLKAAVNSGQKPIATEAKVESQKKAAPTAAKFPEAPTITLPDGDASSKMQWLNEQVIHSDICKKQLRKGEQIVFGSGALNADIFYCGEAPDEEEAETGIPFQGKAGDIFIKILGAMGLKRDAVYMTNLLKWRPEHDKPYGNRPPTQEEMEYCLPYLKAQLEIVQPKVIIGLGNATVPGLLGPDPSRKMASIRGSWQSFDDTPLIFTFKPSYLLFSDSAKTKRMAWEDMLKVMEKVGLPISEKQQGYFLPKQ